MEKQVGNLGVTSLRLKFAVMASGTTCYEDIENMDLSPETQDKFKILLEEVQSGKAHLQLNSEGKLEVIYSAEKKIPLGHVDQSRAHTVQAGKDPDDVRTRVNVCLEMIEAIKQSRAPAGVALDDSKVKISAVGSYKEGQQFQRLKEVLGKGNCAGDIVVVKDNKTGAEQAVKTVMISEFSTDEVRSWVDLGDSESFPSLYLFRLEGNKVVFHMEKIEHGVTLDDIINDHMGKLWQATPDLVRPFSLCVFHGLLGAIREMHDKNWAHRDLHAGNVMLTKDSMTLKVLDFGMAQKLGQGLGFNHEALKNDLLNAIRLFCGVYIGQDFENNFILEKEIKDGTLKEVLTETAPLNKEDREELLQLISMTYQVTQNPQQAGYRDVGPLIERIEGSLFPDKKMDILRKAAAVLFPDFYFGSMDISLARKATDVTDGSAVKSRQMKDTPEFDLDAAAASVPEEFVQKLNIRL